VGMFVSIEKGVLYVVAMPIGNRKDISLRAIDVLREAQLIAAEDTRHSGPLLKQLGIDTPMLALHEHNERGLVDSLVERLREGGNLALISDAGTPLISDPGFALVRECHRQGIRVSPIPGASAVTCALSAAGLPTDRFSFEGFPPRTRTARRERFKSLAAETGTLVFYESGHRIQHCVSDLVACFGGERPVVMARELTKLYETILFCTLNELCDRLEDEPVQRKGEFVILIGGEVKGTRDLSAESERVLRILQDELPLKQACSIAARITGEKRNLLYRLALDRQKSDR